MAVQKCNREVPTHRLNAKAPTTRPAGHVMMNGGRRHHAALLGAELAAGAVGLQGGQRDHPALRTIARPGRIDGGGLAVRLRGAGAVLRPSSSTPSACRARPATSWAPSTSAATSSRRRARRPYPMPPLRSTGYLDRMTASRPGARLAPLPRPGGNQLGALPGPLAVHVPRLLQSRRLPRGRQERPQRHDHSARAADRAPQGGDRSARHEDRGERPGQGHRGHLRDRQGGVLPAGQGRAALDLHLRELAAAAAVDVEGLPEGTGEQPRPGRPSLLLARHRRVGDRALPLQPEQLVRPAGAGRRGGRLGRRQLRSRPAGLHRRRQPVGVLGSPPDRRRQHEHLRQGTGLGQAVEGVRQGERRSGQHRLPAEDHAALRGQLSSTSIPR